MELDLRALQMAVESENSVEHTREVLTKAVEYFSSDPDNEWKVKMVFEQLRDRLDFSTLDEKNIFLIDAEGFTTVGIPEEFKEYPVGMFSADSHYCLYTGRLVYPVRDPKGFVMGLCGWDPIDQPKYLDSKTYGYNAKRNCLYGMEKLSEYYTSTKPVFIVEGIVCCNYLRSKGFQALALLGSSISSYVVEIFKRFGYRCILLPDNDEAGLNVLKSAKFKLPKARCYVSTVAKDVDDTRKIDGGKYEQEFLKELSSLDNPFVVTRILRMLK